MPAETRAHVGKGGEQMKRRIGGTFLLVIFCAMMFGMTAFAKNELTQDNFDYEWYLEQHPDLAVLIPLDNKEAIWAFYVNTGEPAGWYGRIALDWYVRKYFNAARYAQDNPDVAQIIGNDPQALLDHYLNYGMAEGRKLAFYGYCPYDRVYAVAAEIINPGMSDREKVTAIHDWVCGHTTYDYDSFYAGKIPEGSHSVEGLFDTGKSVCQGYADTMKALMDAAGLRNELVSGYVKNGASGGGAHAWNRVYIGNEWLYVDATWDDWDIANYICHDCCLISEARMDDIHNGNVRAWRHWDGTIHYY